MKLKVTEYLLVCADNTNLLGVSDYTQNKNAVTLLVTNMYFRLPTKTLITEKQKNLIWQILILFH